MTEKYIDLASRISNESGAYHLRDTIIEGVLEWLDEHPDQVPGQTITRSTMHELISEHFYTPVREIDVEVYTEALGRLVVPDPEPTNAEKLEQLHQNWSQSDRNPPFGEWADSVGIQAPEDWGDDD